MANHTLLIPIILRWEGGFANDPLDQGGATFRGVTIATYRDYRKRRGYASTSVDDLKAMTSLEWQDIFKSLYWDRWRADSIDNQALANILVDWVWASGSNGIRIPQRMLGVTPDGIVGPRTIDALNAQKPAEFFHEIKAARIQFVEDIVRRKPPQARFIKGWKNRINEFEFYGK